MKSLSDKIRGPMDPEFAGVRFPEPNLFSPSELYHENSKLHPTTASALGARIEMFLGHRALQEAAAHPYKVFGASPRIALPSAQELSKPITHVLAERQCIRSYDPVQDLPLQFLADWLGWGCGLLQRGADHPPGRTYPSGGGLYPLEVYLAIRRVQGLPKGLFHYNLREHSLEHLAGEGEAEQVVSNLTQEDAASGCHLVVLITAVFMRSQYKYGERGYRFVLLEAGHLMQNLCLLAPAVGLGITPIGGFYDDKLHDVLGVNGVDEALIYTATAGLPAG